MNAKSEKLRIYFRLKVVSLVFGLGSWIAITGFWVELPVLIPRLPEGWKLAAYMNVMIQAANIGPLVYYFLRKWKLCSEVIAVHIQMILGVMSCILLVTHWDYTALLFGQKRSIVLLIAAFGLSIVDCTSSVTFLPFMSRFRSAYLTPYLIGEGLSGFIPTVVALLQGVDDSGNQCSNNTLVSNMNTNSSNSTTNEATLSFGAEVFFASLLSTLIISWISFIYLLNSPIAKQEQKYKEKILKELEIDRNTEKCMIEMKILHKKKVKFSKYDSESDEVTPQLISHNSKNACNGKKSTENMKKISSKQFWGYQVLMGFCCLTTFGIMPPLQPYSSLPFGNTTLYLTVICAGLSYPFGCFLAMLIKSQILRSQKFIYIITFVGTMVAVYVLIAASMSPNPPLLRSNKEFGSFIIICSWTVFTIILSYVKTVVTQILNDNGGNEALFWVGMFTQIGSAVGAAFMFLAVDYWNLFQDSCR